MFSVCSKLLETLVLTTCVGMQDVLEK